MKKLLYLGLLSVCVLLGSCVEKNVSNVFDKVERYMDVYPDSALLLLEQIPHPEELRGKQRADYALLLTQARDKNYLDSLQSDSLIKIAVDYYKDDGVKAGKALFCHVKVTAIVGASGSGKTTLVKLMLGFYSPNKGAVKVGDASLENINPHLWRAKTGAVMQDGFIFSETIAQNIVVGEEQVDVERLRHAVTVANIRDFIDSLPLGYNTKIGMEGNGISQGQKQRLLIARAVYKNPEFLFFDEATNALDANNEKEIMEHLHEFYKGKTVVVVAHRLSTVKDADKIVVLDKGCIVEEGTHRELTERKGLYYRLVKNQLELGS